MSDAALPASAADSSVMRTAVVSEPGRAATASLDSSAGAAAPSVSARTSTTYSQIFKSTAIIGGSSVISIALGIVRTKATASILGPAGVGLMGIYGSITDLTQSLAGMGIQASGVRQVAEAAGSNDTVRIAETATVLRRASIALGALGAMLLIGLSVPIAQITFGGEHQTGIAVLSAVVFFRLVSAGQTALIQGMRRISHLARLNVIAAFGGTAITIPLLYLFRERAVVPSLLALAAVSLASSWWYSRKIAREMPPQPSMPATVVRRQVSALLTLGFAFMASAFLTMGAAYAVRLIVLRAEGVGAAGLYQSAWALGGLYVGIILHAMGSDFYPRLTATAADNAECNRLVNEQAYVSLLLAGPGVIATLTLAPLVVALFYSSQFAPAVGLLRWICLGMMLRVIAWPMGFIIIAKGARAAFFWTEAAATLVHVGLAWWLVSRMGLNGAGAAFLGLYVWHGALIYVVVRRLSGFRWSVANRQLAYLFLPLTAAVFCGFYLFPYWLAMLAGVAAALVAGLQSARGLASVLPLDRLPPSLAACLLRCGVGGPRVA